MHPKWHPKQKSGAWRVKVRRKGLSVSETFVRYEDAKKWGVDTEPKIDRGETPTPSRLGKLRNRRPIDLHIADMTEVGKPPRRSKGATLAMLKRRLGALNMIELDREGCSPLGVREPQKAPAR
jgi:hypothetical protein